MQAGWYMDWQSKRRSAWVLLLCGDKTEAVKHRKAVSCKIGLCSNHHLWSSTLSNNYKNALISTSGRDGILRRVHGVTFGTKCAAVKFVKPWTSSHFSSESKDPSYVDSSMRTEYLRKDWRRKSCWLHHEKETQSRPKTRWCDYISDLKLHPVLMWSQQNYLDCCWSPP